MVELPGHALVTIFGLLGTQNQMQTRWSDRHASANRDDADRATELNSAAAKTIRPGRAGCCQYWRATWRADRLIATIQHIAGCIWWPRSGSRKLV